MQANSVFEGLLPSGLWEHFASITGIPRPSGREEQVSAYVETWAHQLGYPIHTDVTGNLCVHVPGHRDRLRSPVVVLQGHLDMVCERDPASPYDAERGNIHPVRDGDWIRADGTTLGADNGIGLAAMLHVAESPDIVRGPLDLLFTVDEETGLTGAQSLDPKILRGRILLNLDNEDDGELCVSCAGSSDATVTMRCPLIPVDSGWSKLCVQVGGLVGGHSGMDIVKPRLNAIRALARLLQRVANDIDLRLVTIKGGNKRNAIPREASAVVVVPAGSEDLMRKAINQEAEMLRTQYAEAEGGLEIHAEMAGDGDTAAWSVADTRRLLDLLLVLPCGALAMSSAIVGLVETSNSLGTVVTDSDEVQIGCLTRSSLKPAMEAVINTIRFAARLAGAEVGSSSGYPGWQSNPNSRVLEVARSAFHRLFRHDPSITGVHAGLECGIIGERVPGMDMLSFGPNIKGPHAPGERVQVESVERFWQLLVAVLGDLSRT